MSCHYTSALIFPLVFLLTPLQGYTADISGLKKLILKVCQQNNLTGRECATATQNAVRKLPDDILLSLLKNTGAARFLLQAKTRRDLRLHKQSRLRPAQYSQLDQPLHPVRNPQINPTHESPYRSPMNSRVMSQGVSERSHPPHIKLPSQHHPDNQSIPAMKSVNDTSAESRYKSYLQQQQQMKEALRSPQSRDHLARSAANYLLNTASKKQHSHKK